MVQHAVSLAAPIRQIARQALGKEWQLYGLLLDHWAAIVGAEWAELIAPVKLTFPSYRQEGGRQALRDGALTVAAPRGLAMEIQYQQPQILARVNGFLGAGAIGRLIVTHAIATAAPRPAPPRPLTGPERQALHAALAPVTDQAMNEALLALGEAVTAATTKR